MAPAITDSAIPGSSRVHGRGRPDLPVGGECIQIFSAGNNQEPEAGGGDDELLGIGGTAADGRFIDLDGLGIGLTRALVLGEAVYAIDACAMPNLVGPAVRVRDQTPVAAPLLSQAALIVLTLGLVLIGCLKAWRPRHG